MNGTRETHRHAVWVLPVLLALFLLAAMAGTALDAAWAQGAAAPAQHQAAARPISRSRTSPRSASAA